MLWAVKNGIIAGYSPDTLAPQALATRAQLATILQRVDQMNAGAAAA